MELFLTLISILNAAYYIFLCIYSGEFYVKGIIWFVSAIVFFLIAVLLHVDDRNRKEHKKSMMLEVRTAIITSCILYFIIIIVFVVMIFMSMFNYKTTNCNYIILVYEDNESCDNKEIYETANKSAYHYLKTRSDTNIILSGNAKRYMQDSDKYNLRHEDISSVFLEKGIKENRIIVENISKNFRQNIAYSYANILMDWFESKKTVTSTPKVGMICNALSIYRYNMVCNYLDKDISFIVYYEPFYLWAERIREEISMIITYHFAELF